MKTDEQDKSKRRAGDERDPQRAWPPAPEEMVELHGDQARFPGKYQAKTASWLFVPLLGSAMGQEALFPYFPINDRDIQNLILRLRLYLPRANWDWQRTGAAYNDRFRGVYFGGDTQDQIKVAISRVDAGGDRLIGSIEAFGNRMVGVAIQHMEALWRQPHDAQRH